ncbi:hypothetical protein JCM10049v2_003033 [Rhodotorula toruloides]
MAGDNPPLFVPLEGETPYAHYLNKLHAAVPSAILHEPTPTREQAQAATDVFFAYQKVPGEAMEEKDKENFAINRDAALRAFGAVTTRRGLGPGLGLQVEKGREKRGGRRSVGGAGEADEEENDTPATKRRKGAQNVSLEDLYQKLDELASHVKTRCITKDDLKHLATKEDLKTLATKVEALEDTVKDRNKKVESLEKTVKDVKQKVEALEKTVKDVNRKVEGLENAVKDMNKKVGALEETVKGLGVKVDEALKKDGTLDKAFATVQTDLTDLKQAIIDLQTVVQVLPGLQRSLADIENYVKTRRADIKDT